MTYTICSCHTEESSKLREHKQRTSGAEVSQFIPRKLHQLALARFALFSGIFAVNVEIKIDDLVDSGPCHYDQ